MSGEDVTERVERYDTGCSLTVELKRGTGTRDQDKIDVKVKGSQPDDVAHKLKMTLDSLEANGVADTLRETQPGETDE